MEEATHFKCDDYGYDPGALLTDAGEVRRRLDAILNARVMRFNPYSVSDEALLACVGRAYFRPFHALTQMVMLHFGRIVPSAFPNSYGTIEFRIGNDTTVHRMPVGALIGKFTYRASRRQNWNLLNSRRITNGGMVERMMGKSYFVSHVICGEKRIGVMRPLYRMFRLKGNPAATAAEIRLRMCESKIAMLQEILTYPFSPDYLLCHRGFIDYTTPIQNFIDMVSHFPEVGHK